MARRVFAWIMLIGFVLLITNIIVFRWQLEISFALYLAIIIIFVFKFNKWK